MQIHIPTDAEAFVKNRAAKAGYDSVAHYVYSLILQDEAGIVVDQRLSDAEMTRSLALLDRGMEDAKAGRTVPAKAVLQEIAREHGLTINQ